jgi:PIN domain nuclease of toxin-antitoxin system
VKTRSWLDSFAIMAWIQDEPGAQPVEDLLVEARRKGEKLLLHKAKYPLSLADAFAAATAMLLDAPVVTGDPMFRAVADLVKIRWIA